MRTSCFVLLLIAVATSAHAQGRTSSLFVEGALLGDFDSSQPRSVLAPPWPASAGGSGAIGFQAGHFTARFEAEVPAFHSRTLTETYAGLKSVDVASFRTIIYGALFGGRFRPHRKVELAALAGFSDAIHEDRFSGYDETFLPNGAIVRNDINSRSSYRGAALTAGADAAVRMTSHLLLVPELRFLVHNEYGAVVRPKLAVRWMF
jgi:hypothetical protein